MKKWWKVIVNGCLVVAMAACSIPGGNGSGEGMDTDIKVFQSQKQRETSPAVQAGDLAAVVDGNNQFALNLYQKLSTAPGNLVFSPYSISAALAMTYAGARGNTAKEMADTLVFRLGPEKIHPAFNSLDQALASREKDIQPKEGTAFKLRMANSIWGQSGYAFHTDFLDLLALHYGAGMRVLDFARDPEKARMIINDWVSQQTEQKIKDLLSPDAIKRDTTLVLTNAIYFNASWLMKFNREATRDGPFHPLVGEAVMVPMMNHLGNFRYAEGKDYQALELLYLGRKLSMLVFLPAEGQYTSFEKSLNAARLKEITGALAGRDVSVTLPKFKIETKADLPELLQQLGMKDAFMGGVADFSGMDGSRKLYISKVVHQAVIAVDEEGTEAAAATAVVVARTSMPMNQARFLADRPFIYLIRDNETGAVLFLGRVLNPSAP
jgi:serpin B